ncbi:BatD family protein [Pseudomonas sp. LS44]|uniref:BatD family protein n=1 Tax=Pseudomonas sp. LS44 TaxID=1357074 RepID=UPI00215AA455|nr:BatD family protein [Pseudomonas sp. LS44]UVE16459.1 BatD family protein [Pseudomonas sp. LS44]
MIRLFCAVFLSVLAFTANAASLTASVDRERVSEGETVELTLESDDVTLFGKPDLAPLDVQFEVIGTRQVNRLSTQEGQTRASARWLITLQPKQIGRVVIPALQLGDMHSQPISLQVLKAGTEGESGKVAPVFIDASLDQGSVYVQAQTVLTLRIYHSVSLYDDSDLTPLQMDNARVEQLGETRTYEKQINGVRHGVIELRYAIFPQQSGQLEIPALMFSATTVARSQDQVEPFGPQPGKLVRVKSPKIPLLVKAKPASYPTDVPWLPARSVTLHETWSPEPNQVQVGDSLTRNLMIKVDGLSSAQIPPLPATSTEGLRRYPDQPQLANQPGERGLIGSREDREALVPNRNGRIELPALEVLWWNTREDRLERTSLPERTLEVASNPALQVEPPVATPPAMAAEVPLWPWQLLSAVLAGTTLLGFGLWWRARRQPAILPNAQNGPSPRTLLDDLKRACQANEPHTTRQALDAWARQQPETLADMAARFVPLSDALDGLNGALYSETGQQWQGDELWRAIRSLPVAQQHQATNTESGGLPPLYPR